MPSCLEKVKDKGVVVEIIAKLVDMLSVIFHDHSHGPWDEISEATFYNRTFEMNALIRAIEESVGTRKNIILLGDAGVGKTAIVHNVVSTIASRREVPNVTPYYFDVKQVELRSDSSLLLKALCEVLQKILDDQDVAPPPGLEKLSTVDDRFQKLTSMVRELSVVDIRKKSYPVLIVDDIDYLESVWQRDLIDCLRFLFDAEQVCIVWICRPPALAEIEHEMCFRPKSPFVHIDPIRVDSVHKLRELLVNRLWPLLLEEGSSQDVVNMVTRAREGQGSKKLETILRKHLVKSLGKECKISIHKIPYPFGKRQENFLMRSSNGDLRIVFGMVAHIVSAVQNDPSRFKVDPSGNLHIGRGDFLRILGKHDHHTNPILPVEEKNLWKIINLFEDVSVSSGAPILVNVLQWVAIDGSYGDEYFESMSELGFTRTQAEDAMAYCSHARLVEPKVILTGQYYMLSSRETKRDDHYILTQKGSFYLRDVLEWIEYDFWQGTESYPCFYERILKQKMERDVIELSGNMVLCDRAIYEALKIIERTGGRPGYLKCDLSVFIGKFFEIYGRSYQTVRRIDCDENEYIDTLSEEVVKRAILSADVSYDKGKLKKIYRLEGVFLLIKRSCVKRAVANRHVELPSRCRIPLLDILEVVYEEAWSQKVKEGVDHEKILAKAMRFLQEQPVL